MCSTPTTPTSKTGKSKKVKSSAGAGTKLPSIPTTPGSKTKTKKKPVQKMVTSSTPSMSVGDNDDIVSMSKSSQTVCHADGSIRNRVFMKNEEATRPKEKQHVGLFLFAEATLPGHCRAVISMQAALDGLKVLTSMVKPTVLATALMNSVINTTVET